jgi:NADPH-dependent 2,4-dienoyl-CoA reductase/sulfur reductase-like enzyme/rhodanese-related sulfurtransferase/TusA-related sulfurtransferase
MLMPRVVIVGGVAGGASAAARLRRLNEAVEIIMLDKGPHVSWANCGLPYYIGHVIRERTELELVVPSRFQNRFNIDARVNQEVLSIDRSNKTVKVKNLMKNEEYTIAYDHLILSPGAEPIKPPIPGIEKVPIFLLRTIPDASAIRNYVDAQKPKQAVIVGGGFIGLEMAENLRERGVKVKIIEMLDQVMPPLDREMAQFIHQELILNGVCLILEDPVDSFGLTAENHPYVKTKSGRIVETDFIILSIGIRPETKLAREAKLELGPKGHILVNKYMQTSDPFIYAVGDAVQVTDLITRQPAAIPLAGPANKQGRIAADNICGRNTEYDGILGTAVVKVFDLTVASVGLSEKTLKSTKLQFEKVYLHPNNHSGYYPGAIPMAFKLLFETPTGKILGAQIVGGPGSEKRIDVVSTLIKMGGTVFDLEELELSYAPPYGSAKDAINMAGFIAANTLRGDNPLWHWHDLEQIKKQNGFILDVRTPEEYKLGTIDAAVNISDTILRKKLDKIPKDRPIYVFCATGYRSYLSTRILLQKGFQNVYNLSGGYTTFSMATATTEAIIKACGGSPDVISEMVQERAAVSDEFVELDASGLSCPGPLNALIKALEILPLSKKLKIFATDPSFKASVETYVKLTDAVKLLVLEKREGKIMAILQKQEIKPEAISQPMILEKKTRQELRETGIPPISEINATELYTKLESTEKPAILIDVRSPEEFNGPIGHIKGSKLIPLGELMQNIDQLSPYKDKPIVAICHSGMRSMMAARLLAQQGFKDIRNLIGGMMAWNRKGLPITKL